MQGKITGITGAEFKAFWSDDSAWGEDAFCEDLVFVIQGEEHLDMAAIYGKYGDSFENLPDTAILTLESGFRLQGGIPKPGAMPEEDLIAIFGDWQRERNFASFSASIDVKKDDAETLAKVSRLMDELQTLGASVRRPDAPEDKPKAAKPGR